MIEGRFSLGRATRAPLLGGNVRAAAPAPAARLEDCPTSLAPGPGQRFVVVVDGRLQRHCGDWREHGHFSFAVLVCVHTDHPASPIAASVGGTIDY